MEHAVVRGHTQLALAVSLRQCRTEHDDRYANGARLTVPLLLAGRARSMGPSDRIATGPVERQSIPARRGGYAIDVSDLYLIGAATWPGPGVGRAPDQPAA